MKFYKYHGTGNDFIVIEERNENFIPDEKKTQSLCDRNFGVGSDGLLLLKNHEKYDFEMQFFNPDGSEATFCGNGARCIVAFANFLKIIDKKATFLAKDGEHSAYFNNNDVVLKMIDTDSVGSRQLAVDSSQSSVFSWQSVIDSEELFYLNTGTHHVVKFVDDVDAINIMTDASKIRYHEDYAPHGTNVNFVQECNGFLKIRTYEKGVEKETLSCGTGVVASALVYASLSENNITKIEVKAKGGDLKVSFQKKNNGFENVYLQGNAVQIFEGEVDVF
jgi:diaminopimelate epimerase